MSNKKDLRFIESQISKIKAEILHLKKSIEKIINILQKKIKRSKVSVSETEKNSQVIEKIFQIYKKAFKKSDYKKFVTGKDTLRHFSDLMQYTIMEESGKGLTGTLDPRAYLRELDSKSISHFKGFLEAISIEGDIINLMEDKEKQKIDSLLRKLETSDLGYKVTNWQGIPSLLKEKLESILKDRNTLPTMTVRRIGAYRSSRPTIERPTIERPTIERRGEVKKPLNSMTQNSFSKEEKHSILQKDYLSPRATVAISKVSEMEKGIPDHSAEK